MAEDSINEEISNDEISIEINPCKNARFHLIIDFKNAQDHLKAGDFYLQKAFVPSRTWNLSCNIIVSDC